MTSTADIPAGPSLPLVPHWIDGVEHSSASNRTAPVYDPATGTQTKVVALAGRAEIQAAVASAKAAFPAWSNLSLARRQVILSKFRELLDAHKGELADIITAEHGKVLPDALGEISRGQEVVEFATGLAHHLKGEFSQQVSNGIDVYSTRQPLGGAKNNMLVLPDADLDLTADSAVTAGFGSAGERCMAISVIVAVEPVADELVAKIAERIKVLRVGDGRRGCDMGPLVTQQHRDKVAAYTDIARDGGWKDSLFGDTKAHGAEGVKFFTRLKAVTSRWLDPSHGGINLGFPENH